MRRWRRDTPGACARVGQCGAASGRCCSPRSWSWRSPGAWPRHADPPPTIRSTRSSGATRRRRCSRRPTRSTKRRCPATVMVRARIPERGHHRRHWLTPPPTFGVTILRRRREGRDRAGCDVLRFRSRSPRHAAATVAIAALSDDFPECRASTVIRPGASKSRRPRRHRLRHRRAALARAHRPWRSAPPSRWAPVAVPVSHPRSGGELRWRARGAGPVRWTGPPRATRWSRRSRRSRPRHRCRRPCSTASASTSSSTCWRRRARPRRPLPPWGRPSSSSAALFARLARED